MKRGREEKRVEERKGTIKGGREKKGRGVKVGWGERCQRSSSTGRWLWARGKEGIHDDAWFGLGHDGRCWCHLLFMRKENVCNRRKKCEFIFNVSNSSTSLPTRSPSAPAYLGYTEEPFLPNTHSISNWSVNQKENGEN